MLVYEYMSNSSLDKLLFDDNLLDWIQRVHIVEGIVKDWHTYIMNVIQGLSILTSNHKISS
jgi:hypothetical protein